MQRLCIVWCPLLISHLGNSRKNQSRQIWSTEWSPWTMDGMRHDEVFLDVTSLAVRNIRRERILPRMRPEHAAGTIHRGSDCSPFLTLLS